VHYRCDLPINRAAHEGEKNFRSVDMPINWRSSCDEGLGRFEESLISLLQLNEVTPGYIH
jgi:hypothetical protein